MGGQIKWQNESFPKLIFTQFLFFLNFLKEIKLKFLIFLITHLSDM